MSKRAIVTSAPGAVHNRTRVCTTAEARGLLEGLRTAYQRLGREERQYIKSLVLTLSRALEAHRLSSSETPGSSLQNKEEPAASDVDRQKTESAAIDGMTAE